MVEQIGDLHSQLSANGLLDRDAFNERHGYRLSAWSHHSARLRVSEAADGVSRGRESRRIDPLGDRLPRVRTDSGDRVRPAPGRVENVEAATTGIVELRDRHERTGLKQQHAAEFPSAHYPVDKSVRAIQQHLSPTERQVVKKRGEKAIAS